jgi:predicted deacylase
MKCLGMIKGEPLIKVKPRIIRRSAHVFTEKEGLFYSHVKAGDMVLEGEVIGEIKNIRGETVCELKAPIKGKVFFKLNPLSWGPSLGWFLYMIADVDDYYS